MPRNDQARSAGGLKRSPLFPPSVIELGRETPGHLGHCTQGAVGIYSCDATITPRNLGSFSANRA